MVLTVAVDFDGVLNTYSGWRGEEELFEPRVGVELFLSELSEDFEVVVFTCRDKRLVWDWIVRHGLSLYVSYVTNTKPRAFLYIDDRGYQFDGDFGRALRVARSFRTYWEEDSCG